MKHSEWTRQSAGWCAAGSPTTIANCSALPSAGRKPTTRASSAASSGTRASLTGRSVTAASPA